MLGCTYRCEANTEHREAAMTDLTGKIIAYESGDLDDEATIELFQRLVDDGFAWRLQGHYGRTAKRLIEAGYVRAGRAFVLPKHRARVPTDERQRFQSSA
jgi:hypothetical protein